MKHRIRSLGMLIPFMLFALGAAGCAKHAPAPGQSPPRAVASEEEAKRVVVARVNGTDITLAQLRQIMNRLSLMNQHAPVPASPEEIRTRSLDQLVLQELALQEAARQGLRVDEMVVDSTMEKLIARLGHEEGYQAFLEKQHLTAAEFRSQVERSLLTQLIMNREVVAKAAVSEEDVRKEYERQKAGMVSPEKAAVVDVVFFLKQDDPASWTKANEVRERIIAEKDGDPMLLAPDGTFIAQELEIDKDKDPALLTEARKLKTGELSGVIRGSDSLHIIRLTSYTPEKQLAYDEARASLEASLKAEAQMKRRQEWEQELKKGAKIELLDVAVQ
jgi:hypothetical protein